MRRGNMGHLTRIANAVVQNLERGPMQTHISEVIQGERSPPSPASQASPPPTSGPSAGSSCMALLTGGSFPSHATSWVGRCLRVSCALRPWWALAGK